LPACRCLVFPVGGGGLLMGLTAYFHKQPAPVRLVGCEPTNYPKYAPFHHARTHTIADGLILEFPHAPVQERIAALGMDIGLVPDPDIRQAMKALWAQQALPVEPSSAIGVAYVHAHLEELEEPACVILTGQNITAEDFFTLIGDGISVSAR
jgi:threonine dehydratase